LDLAVSNKPSRFVLLTSTEGTTGFVALAGPWLCVDGTGELAVAGSEDVDASVVSSDGSEPPPGGSPAGVIGVASAVCVLGVAGPGGDSGGIFSEGTTAAGSFAEGGPLSPAPPFDDMGFGEPRSATVLGAVVGATVTSACGGLVVRVPR
jgi:hypothetical protein